jgi:hypothetical protein
MSSWSGRGQVEPLAALAAVFAVAVGLALYAGALEVTLPRLFPDREVAPAAADRLVAEASSFGALDPPLSGAVDAAAPTGYELNATLRAANRTWSAGPPRPPTAECDRRDVGVRVAPGRVRPGRLEVCTWRAR